MTIIEAIISYFEECPLIKDMTNTIKVDFLTEKGKAFSIEPTPTNPVISNWVGGGGERQYTFDIAVKFRYAEEAKVNMDNSGFFEALIDWIEEQNMAGNLPVLGDGKTADTLAVTSNGYLFGVTPDYKYGRYQIQCRLTYEVDN